MLLRTEFIEIRWDQVSSLEVTWAFVLLLFGASVAAIVGLPLWVCLADLSLTPGVVMAAVVSPLTCRFASLRR